MSATDVVVIDYGVGNLLSVRRGLESLASVEPEPVRPMDEVVADVEVGLTITIEIPEHHGQPPVARGIHQSLSLFVQEQPHIPRSHHHVGPASIDVQGIGFPAFEDL